MPHNARHVLDAVAASLVAWTWLAKWSARLPHLLAVVAFHAPGWLQGASTLFAAIYFGLGIVKRLRDWELPDK